MPHPFGLSAALCLPLDPRGRPDGAALAAFARSRLDAGCDSVTLFGTTGEGASLGGAERRELLGMTLSGGVAAERIVVAVTASAVADAAEQAREALSTGCRAVLLAPPYYYKDVSDDGLFGWFAAVIERLGPSARDLIVYHIPSVTQSAIGPDLLARLRDAFGDRIAGLKDSSGDRAGLDALLERHRDIAVLVGDERLLAYGLRRGAQGAISGMANVLPDRMRRLVDSHERDAVVDAMVDAVLAGPVVPGVKALLAEISGEEAWRRVMPPLEPLGGSAAAALRAALADRELAPEA